MTGIRGIVGKTSLGVIGLISALLGTLIALVLFPDDPSSRGALTLPALVLAGGILTVPAIRVFSGSKSTLNAENFVALGFVYWILLDPIQGAYDLSDASDEAIRYALSAVGVSAAAMWAGTLGAPWRVPRFFVDVATMPLKNATLMKIIAICFLLGMANYVYSVNFDLWEMFSYLGEPRWTAPWSRGQLGGWDAFLDHTQYFGYVLPSLAALLVVRRGLRPDSVLALVAAVIMVLFLSQGGGRRIVGVSLGAAIIVWTLAQPSLKVRNIVGAAAAVIGVLVLMEFMLEIRSQGFEGFVESGTGYDYLHVDDNLLRLAQIIEIVPAEHPFVYLKQIFFVMVRPIPRIFWEGKPIDPGFDLPYAVGLEGVSLSTSIIGEWYLCLGWAAVIFGGWLHGRLASATNALREGKVAQNNPVVFGLAVMVLVSGVRSMQDLIIMSYAVLAWFGVSWLVARRRSQQAART
jgi:hypothetical protein